MDMAEQVGLWHQAADGREIERLSAPADPVYDRAALAQRKAEFEGHHAAWRAWFAAEGITPLHLSYEAIAQDPLGALRRVLAHLDLPEVAADGDAIPTARLSDGINADWMDRFKRGE